MTPPEHSLYTRLGGYDVIASVIDEMFAALLTHDIGDTERAEFLDLFERYRDEIVED